MARCPICGQDAKPRADNPAFPFCTARCKTIDLGKWVNEEYRVSTEAPDADMDADMDAMDADMEEHVDPDAREASRSTPDVRH